MHPRSPLKLKTALIIDAIDARRASIYASEDNPDLVERRFNLPMFNAIALSAKLPAAHPFDTSIEGLRRLTHD